MESEFRKRHREAFEKAMSEQGAAAFFERFLVTQSKLKEELKTDPAAMRKYMDRPGKIDEHSDSMNPEEREKAVLDAMERAGIPPEVIYAYRKTRLVTAGNSQLSEEDTARWEAAIEEYQKQHPDQGGS